MEESPSLATAESGASNSHSSLNKIYFLTGMRIPNGVAQARCGLIITFLNISTSQSLF
jgi:hypothetical protein